MRKQIDRVESLLDKADEPQAVDRFANALTRLYEVERELAGRPRAGTRRPKDNEPKAAVTGAWIEEQPAPPAAPDKPTGWEYETPACGADTPMGSGPVSGVSSAESTT